MAMNQTNKIHINIKTVIRFLKKNYIPICAALAVLIIGITVLALVFSGGEDGASESEPDTLWGSGLTENIPAFSQGCDDIDIGEGYVAAYYENVMSEKVGEYAKLLETELAVSFSKDKYPYVAEYGDKIIALHYNVTEMRFSITVTEKNISK